MFPPFARSHGPTFCTFPPFARSHLLHVPTFCTVPPFAWPHLLHVPTFCTVPPFAGLVWLVYWGLTPQQQPGSSHLFYGPTFCTVPPFAHLHLQIHMPTSSLSSYLPESAKSAVTSFRQIVTLRWKPCQYRTNVYGRFGKHPGRPWIALEHHNDIMHLWWHHLPCMHACMYVPWYSQVAASLYY